MKNVLALTFLALCVLVNLPAHANSQAQLLGVCLTDSLTGKERKNLAKWIYFGMSEHSTIAPYASIPEKDKDASNRFIGELVTRLLTEDCPELTKSAFEEGGASALETAFRVVGEVAIQELMAEPGVNEGLSEFEKYINEDRINDIFN